MNPHVQYKLGKSIRPYSKFGSSPFSTFLFIICLTLSRAYKSTHTLSLRASRYSSSFDVSSAILARFIVDTFTEPTFSAVPPIELKSVILYFHIGLDYFLYVITAHTPISVLRINSSRTSLSENSLYRF